jgi:hypothetical protein
VPACIRPNTEKRSLSQSIKIRLYKRVTRPIVIHGAETLSVTNKIEYILMTWERKRIYGPTNEMGQWNIKTNSELTTKYKSQDIVSVIKIWRLEWLWHVIRMNETTSVKKIFEGKLEGRRGRGRPRLRWIDDVEDDLRKMGTK